jgi:hypothetical protein
MASALPSNNSNNSNLSGSPLDGDGGMGNELSGSDSISCPLCDHEVRLDEIAAHMNLCQGRHSYNNDNDANDDDDILNAMADDDDDRASFGAAAQRRNDQRQLHGEWIEANDHNNNDGFGEYPSHPSAVSAFTASQLAAITSTTSAPPSNGNARNIPQYGIYGSNEAFGNYDLPPVNALRSGQPLPRAASSVVNVHLRESKTQVKQVCSLTIS